MGKITKPKTSKSLAAFCSKVAQEKLASNILVMDLTKIENSPADYFVLCTCDSTVQVKALTDSIIDGCIEAGIKKPSFEGVTAAYWVLADFFDVVMHIMLPEARNFYKIEQLWGDAKFTAPDESGKLKAFNSKNLKYD